MPKTIDNDLAATDYTFGFDTAVAIATEAIDRLHSTAESHNRVMVVEVMGRHTGWIAVMSGIAGGADVILIPEHPMTVEDACSEIERRHERGKDFSIVVVSEGYELTYSSGESQLVAGQARATDQFGHVVLGGVGDVLAREIESRTGFETRVTVLGHVQRGGTPTARDRVLATRYGLKAARPRPRAALRADGRAPRRPDRGGVPRRSDGGAEDSASRLVRGGARVLRIARGNSLFPREAPSSAPTSASRTGRAPRSPPRGPRQRCLLLPRARFFRSARSRQPRAGALADPRQRRDALRPRQRSAIVASHDAQRDDPHLLVRGLRAQISGTVRLALELGSASEPASVPARRAWSPRPTTPPAGDALDVARVNDEAARTAAQSRLDEVLVIGSRDARARRVTLMRRLPRGVAAAVGRSSARRARC